MRNDDRAPDGRAAARQAKLDALHETLTDAVHALVTGEDWQRAMVFAARFRRYSFGNCMLLYSQSLAAYEAGLLPVPYPRYVAGYRAWQSLGRQVRAGSRGFQILAPVTARVVVTDDGSYRRLDKGEKPAPGEMVATRMVGVRPTTVFPAEFTDGDAPIPEPPAPRLLQGEAPPGLWDGLAALIRAKGFALDDVATAAQIGGANGVTMWGPDKILVRADMEPLARVKTLSHEAGHLYGHAPDDPDVPAHRGIAEIEAESVAAFVLGAHGVDSADYTVPYVAAWAGSVKDVDPVTAVQQTAARVRTIALQILDGLEPQKVSDGDPPGLDRSTGRTSPSRSEGRSTPVPLSAASSQAPVTGEELTRRGLPLAQDSPPRAEGIGR
ncbi:ArdC family protein [Myceligenerans xiligouense]|uniref:Antirestriction protein ArdC n=1 Tax=Myceligenerans xiligouense TaxID=253184 RepID=A0A3N4Z7L7_9MICO|nr:ArdC-like ssDNA-binding domain-containing protein [Myceligenerans xiligouense]RPF21312.1 antirestriction protein ArdC [Myceligenerans xiligouense]